MTPPRWAERFLRHALSPTDRDTITGDLLEEYRETIVPALGIAAARRWYLRQALSIAFSPRLAGQWMIWLIATIGLIAAFAIRYRVGPPFPTTLAIAAGAMFSLRAARVRVLCRVSMSFGVAFVIVAGIVTIGAAVLRPLPDMHAVLMAYGGIRGKLLVACGALVFVVVAFRAAGTAQRIGVGVLAAMGAALVGAFGYMLLVTAVTRVFPNLLAQLGPLGSLALPWPDAPFDRYYVSNHLELISLSVLPALPGAVLGRTYRESREARRRRLTR